MPSNGRDGVQALTVLGRDSSIHSRKSILPLNITQDLMRKILSYYQVESNFLDVLYSFGDEPHLAEGGSSNVVTMTTANGSRSEQSCFHHHDELSS